MELIEKPNMRAIHYLNRTTFSQFKNDCLSEAKVCGDKRPKESDIHVWYNTLKQFCATHIKTKGITTRIYAYSQNTCGVYSFTFTCRFTFTRPSIQYMCCETPISS